MLITQPPIAEFRTVVFWDDHETGGDASNDVMLKNAKGLTMGDVTRAMEKELRHNEEQSPEYTLSTYDLEDLMENLDEDVDEER